MEALVKLASIAGLSLTSGINLYATIAIAGLVTRFDIIQGLPAEFQAFNNDWVIAVALLLYFCEFAADKIPGFDTAWDTVHTFIRPFGAALISMTVVGEAEPSVEVLAALMGASLALTTHATKAGFRLLVNTSPEPFSNIAVSLAEDVGVLGMTLLVMAHPYLSLVLSLIALILLIQFGPGLWRGALLVIRAIPARVGAFLGIGGESSLKGVLPDAIDEAVDAALDQGETVLASQRCFARKVAGCGRNRAGGLVLTDQNLLFVYRKLFRTRVLKWKRAEIERTKGQSRFLVDVLGVKVQGRFIQFIFLKNQSGAVAACMNLLGNSGPEASQIPLSMVSPAKGGDGR